MAKRTRIAEESVLSSRTKRGSGFLLDAGALVAQVKTEVPRVARGHRKRLSHQHAAVHVQNMAGDVASFVRREKRHGAGHVFRRSYAAQRNLFHGSLFELIS